MYRYTVGISFNLGTLSSVEKVSAITLSLRGETKNYIIDNLILDCETEFEYENKEISTTYAVSDAPIHISTDGFLDLTYFDLQLQEPFTLNQFSFFGQDSAMITDCSVVITNEEESEIEMKWDCKTPIQVLKGETARIYAVCEDPQLSGKIEAVTSKYVMIQYSSVDGKEYTEFVQCIYRMRQGLYDIYAASEGANVQDFYLDYYAVNTNMIKAE